MGEPKCVVGSCEASRNSASGLLGAFVPECKEDGSYKEKQCHGSTGHCWCVDQSGKEIDGSKKGPGAGKVRCGDVAPPAPVTSCVAARNAVPAGLLGAFVPECKEDGSYKEKQCHGSTGHCWCV